MQGTSLYCQAMKMGQLMKCSYYKWMWIVLNYDVGSEWTAQNKEGIQQQVGAEKSSRFPTNFNCTHWLVWVITEYVYVLFCCYRASKFATQIQIHAFSVLGGEFQVLIEESVRIEILPIMFGY